MKMDGSNKTLEQQPKNIDVEQAQQQQIVPVLEQDYSVSKETSISEVKIEKRLVTKTKTVKVPVVYEELYINDKKLRSVEEYRIISALKDKIDSISSRDNPSSTVEQSIKKKNKIENRGELVPLLSSSDEGNSETQGEKERIIPLYEEQLEINKKWSK